MEPPAIWPLSWMADEAELTLPPSSRSEAEGPIEIAGPWRLIATVNGVRTWEAPSPVRTRTLFFNRPPDDMALLGRAAGAEWAQAREVRHKGGMDHADQPHTWTFTADAVHLRLPIEDGPPQRGAFAVRYTRALEREASFNLEHSGLSPERFAFRSVQVDATTRRGLFLPAPASARFTLTPSPGAVLDLDAMVVPPEAEHPGGPSDGADLVVRVDGEEIARLPLEVARSELRRLSLDAWADREIALELASEPGGSEHLDYVFVADPVVFTPQDDPPRVLMVFIDTLRVDHLSLYEYPRQTTPLLDDWADDAAVFTQARSVSPWTLPAARAMLLGRQPEAWRQQPALHDQLGAAGWATTYLAGNVYLSSNFEMAEGWGTHRCVNWPQASVQVDRGLEQLDTYSDRPLLMVLHFMDMHLPYTEPLTYRGVFAGDRPEGLQRDNFLRGEVLRANLDDAGRQYVLDRYDNNLRYIDDQLHRILGALGPDDTVVVLADHGEEFWDHDGFEHGHTIHEELVRIPLVVRGRGVTPGRYDAPVSLLDVPPTILRSLGLPEPETDGLALQELTDGTAGEDRALAFGRPLYGHRRWGVAADGQKYMTSEGAEHLYDLSADPGERADLLLRGKRPEPWRARLSEALGRPVALGFRLIPTTSKARSDLMVELTVPGGVERIVIGEDPLQKSSASAEIDGEVARITWKGGMRGTREVFVIPQVPAAEVASEVSMRAKSGSAEMTVGTGGRTGIVKPPRGRGGRLTKARIGGRTVSLTWGVVPIPPEGGRGVEGFDEEMRGELEALGYFED